MSRATHALRHPRQRDEVDDNASSDLAESTTVVRPPVNVRNLALSVLAVAAVIVLLRYMQDVFIPFVLAGLLFYTLDPFVDRLEKARVPRAIAAAVVLLIALGAAGALAFRLSGEAMSVVNDLPIAARKLRTAVQELRGSEPGPLDKVQQAAEEMKRAAESVGSSRPAKGVVQVQVEQPAFKAGDLLVNGSWSVLSMLGSVVIVVFLTYFLLLTDDLFKRRLVELSGPTLSEKKITVQMLDEIAAQIERFLLVQVFTSCVVGVVTWLALWWLGLEDAAFWGFVAGILNSIPYFGPVIVTVGLGVIALLQFGTLYMAGLVAVVSLAITTAEGWLLTPTLLSRTSQMNQVAIFAGLLFWSWAWGVWGLLLAVPMLMVLKAVCDRIDTLQPIGKFLGE